MQGLPQGLPTAPHRRASSCPAPIPTPTPLPN